MANYSIILTLLLLCTVATCVKGNTEKPNKTEHQSTTVSGQHEALTVGLGSHHEQDAAKEPQDKKKMNPNQNEIDSSDSDEDASIQELESNSTDALNQTTPIENLSNNKPGFRRYIDLTRNVPIIEKRVDNTWVRLRPPLGPHEKQEVNVSRYAYYPNGSRLSLRSKFDYSYDDVGWFRSSRIKIPVSQFANGTTIFQYRFGPKRWIGANRNRIFLNGTTLFYQDAAPGQNVYHFSQDSYFRPPPSRGRPVFDQSFNGTVPHQRHVYRYGPATERNAGPGGFYRRYGRRYYDRWYDYNNYHQPQNYYPDNRRWGPQNRYYDYYGYRPPYNDPRYTYTDPHYNYHASRMDRQMFYDRRYRPDGTYYNGAPTDERYHSPSVDQRYHSDPGSGPNDGRYQYDVTYDDKKYQSDRMYNDKRYPSNGPYDDRKYQSDKTYDDKRYHSDSTYDDRKNPPEATYNDARNRGYDTRGPDRASNYDGRRNDQGYEGTYNRRRDRQANREYDGYDQRPASGSQDRRWNDRPTNQ